MADLPTRVSGMVQKPFFIIALSAGAGAFGALGQAPYNHPIATVLALVAGMGALALFCNSKTRRWGRVGFWHRVFHPDARLDC